MRLFCTATLLFCLATPSQAAVYCTDLAPAVQSTFVEFTPGANPQLASTMCGARWCTTPVLNTSVQLVAQAGCDATVPTGPGCYVRANVPLQLPGNSRNPSGAHTQLFWFREGNTPPSGACIPGGPPIGTNCSPNSVCGAGFNEITTEEGTAYIQVAGLRCNNLDSAPGLQAWNLAAISCNFSTASCVRRRLIPVDLSSADVAGTLGCPDEPPPYDCECNVCKLGGGGGSGNGGDGSGGYGDNEQTGPGARLYYRARGAGSLGHPGSTAWRTELGIGWSHHYATRIIEDPDPSHVWLVTEKASFREFSNPDAGGVYQTVNPSDEYRTLTHLAAGGWELQELDGTIHAFNTAGRWTRTTDRFGNAKTATYIGSQLTQVTFPDARSELFAYHPSGKLATITEVGVDGTTTRTWAYTWAGDQLTRIDAPDGTALTFLYTGGYLTRVTKEGTSGGQRVEAAWEYTNGRVTRLWRGDAAYNSPNAVELYQFSYDVPSLPAQVDITDPLGNISTYHLGRDPAGTKPRLEQLEGDCPTCGLGPNTALTYADASNPLRPTLEVDGRGIMTAYTYDAHGQLTSRVEALGTALERETTWEYDATYPALVTRMERPSVQGGANTRLTVHTYDASGALQQTQETGFEAGAAFVLDTLYTTNTAGQRTSQDPPGHGTADTMTYAYDATRGDLIMASRTDPLIGTTTYGHDPFNRRTEVTDVNGVLVTTSYDALNRITQVVQHGALPAEDLTTTYAYNQFGNLNRVTLPRGNVIEYGYDTAGRLLTVQRKPNATTPAERTLYTLDAYGHRVQENLQQWSGSAFATQSTTGYLYSTRCHLDQVQHADGSVTELDYDCNGNLAQLWDANHPSAGQTAPPTTLYAYDDLNRLEQVSQLWGPGPGAAYAQTSYGYDIQDHLTSITDAEGSTTTYQYSDRDLMTRETSPVSGITIHAYSDSGQPESETDARSITTLRSYDALDRLTLVDYSGTDLDTTYTYDDLLVPFSFGRLTQISRSSGNVDYAYDRFGRMTQDGALSYSYDANGNRETLTYPGGFVATYTFDYADREISLTAQPTGGVVQSIASNATYAALGPLQSLDFGNGLSEARAWTSRYFPQSIELSGPGGTLLLWNYSTDGEGNITAITNPNNAADSRSFSYQDVQYYLSTGNGPWGNLSWTYDQIGNRLSETRDGVTDTYSYLQNASSGNTAILQQVQLGIGGFHTYQHGPAGHMTQVNRAGNVTNLAYDAASRLSRLLQPATGNKTDFLYDGRSYLSRSEAGSLNGIFRDGFEQGTSECWSQTVTASGTTAGRDCQTLLTQPTYSSDGVLRSLNKVDARNSVDELEHFFYFAGRPVAQVTVPAAGAVVAEWITTDHLGTPVVVSDVAGAEVWSGGFEPFGADWSGAGAAGLELRLPGQWADESWEANGNPLWFNVHRWYLPELARYSRPDPLGLKGGMNHFLFVEAAPLVQTDPTGLQGTNEFHIPTPEEIAEMQQRVCARNSFRSNYNAMIEANWKLSDKYFHCKANCEATRCGPFGYRHACELSDLRELFDQLIKENPPSTSEADQVANRFGRDEAMKLPDSSCQIVCARFRPKGLPEEY